MARPQAAHRTALLSQRDARELAWWRTVFATRFHQPLPKVGSALVGKRFRLVDETDDYVAMAIERSRKRVAARRPPS